MRARWSREARGLTDAAAVDAVKAHSAGDGTADARAFRRYRAPSNADEIAALVPAAGPSIVTMVFEKTPWRKLGRQLWLLQVNPSIFRRQMSGDISANLVVALAAFIQASAGVGYAMVAVPLLALIDLRYVPGPSLFAMLWLSAIMAWRDRAAIDRQGLISLVPGLGAGTLIGAPLLGWLPASALGLLFGSMVLVGLAIGRSGLVLGQSLPAFGLAGVFAGLMGTMAGIHGPALVVVYQGAEPRKARATIALIFVIASVFSLLSLHRSGLFGQAEFRHGLLLLPGLLTGYGLARLTAPLIDDLLARRAMLVLAGLTALILIGKSLWSI